MVPLTVGMAGWFRRGGDTPSADTWRYHLLCVRRNYPRPALEQHPARSAELRADRHAGLPALAIRSAAGVGLSGLPRRDTLAVRACPRHVSSRSPHAHTL